MLVTIFPDTSHNVYVIIVLHLLKRNSNPVSDNLSESVCFVCQKYKILKFQSEGLPGAGAIPFLSAAGLTRRDGLGGEKPFPLNISTSPNIDTAPTGFLALGFSLISGFSCS